MADGPKIVLWDIERRPALVYAWGMFDQNIAVQQVVEPASTISVAWKTVGDRSKPSVASVRDRSYAELVQTMWEILDDADILVGYNTAAFDHRLVNGEFMEAGLTPPSPYRVIDLYSVIKSQARFQSGKLAWVGPALVGEWKQGHAGFAMWRACMEAPEGSEEYEAAWDMMESYNQQDVAMMEPLFEKLLPWIPNFPSRALYGSAADGDAPTCPRCDSPDAIRRGWRTTAARRYRRYVCRACGGWFQHGAADKGARATTNKPLQGRDG